MILPCRGRAGSRKGGVQHLKSNPQNERDEKSGEGNLQSTQSHRYRSGQNCGGYGSQYYLFYCEGDQSRPWWWILTVSCLHHQS